MRLQRAENEIAAVLNGTTCSYWLRDALRKAMDRDPVDVARDATYLAEMLNERCDAILGIPKR